MAASLRNRGLDYWLSVGFILAFLYFTFDPVLGTAYIFLLLLDQWFYNSDKNVTFVYSRDKNITKSLISAVIGLAAFLGISTLLNSLPQFQSVFELLATSTPLLKNSKLLTFIGWGLLIPIIETNFFFGRLLEGLPEILGERAGLRKLAGTPSSNIPFLKKIFMPSTIFTMVLVSIAFTLFHLSSKGAESIPLLITFIFGIISCAIVMKDKETRGAVYLHIAVNSLTVLLTYGIL
jgi:membrane protease YdiL (CAAX protease family)